MSQHFAQSEARISTADCLLIILDSTGQFIFSHVAGNAYQTKQLM